MLDERAGRTAHEAADAAAARLPGARRRSSSRPDASSTRSPTATSPPSADDDARLRELDARVRAARPARPSVPPCVPS